MGPLLRPILLAVGLVSLVLGVIGAFLPIMPTTPFLLLSAYCFARSSRRLHHWLVTHPQLGCYIEGFLYGGAVPRRAKVAALTTLWPAIAISCAIIQWRVESRLLANGVCVTIVLIASAVSIYILTRPTADSSTCEAERDSSRTPRAGRTRSSDDAAPLGG